MVNVKTVRQVVNQRFLRNLFPMPATNPLALGSFAPPFELWAVQRGEKIRLWDFVGTHTKKTSKAAASPTPTPAAPAPTSKAPQPKRPVILAFTRIFSEQVYCPLCYPHIVELNQQYDQFTQRGAEVLMIVSLDVAQAKTVVNDLNLQVPLLCDPSGRVFRLYGTGQALGAPLPAQFLVDPAGRVRFRHLFSFLEPNASVERLLVALDRHRSGIIPSSDTKAAQPDSVLPSQPPAPIHTNGSHAVPSNS